MLDLTFTKDQARPLDILTTLYYVVFNIIQGNTTMTTPTSVRLNEKEQAALEYIKKQTDGTKNGLPAHPMTDSEVIRYALRIAAIQIHRSEHPEYKKTCPLCNAFN
jgi:hypothetical protein